MKACNNRRLKPYLYVLASGGMRANEALNLRLKDVDFTAGSPTKVHIRKENITKRSRDIFISDEATKYLKQWIDWKYRKRRIGTKMVTPEKSGDHHIFTLEIKESTNPAAFYPRLNEAFRKLLKSIGFDERKEDSYRGKITLNSFRRFVYSTISTFDPAYAEWFLGHTKSPYWQFKEEKKKEIYLSIMNSLTFLDFSRLEATSKNIESRIDAKEKQIQILTEKIRELESSTTLGMSEMRKITAEINKKFKHVEDNHPDYSIDAFLDFRDVLPYILDIHKIPFSLMGSVLKRINVLGWGGPYLGDLGNSEVYKSIEEEMVKLGILTGNKLDLKKLAYHDPKGEMLKAL